MNNFDISVVSITRSGHHAILNWIAKNLGDYLFVNNTPKESSIFYNTSGSELIGFCKNGGF